MYEEFVTAFAWRAMKYEYQTRQRSSKELD